MTPHVPRRSSCLDGRGLDSHAEKPNGVDITGKEERQDREGSRNRGTVNRKGLRSGGAGSGVGEQAQWLRQSPIAGFKSRLQLWEIDNRPGPWFSHL